MIFFILFKFFTSYSFLQWLSTVCAIRRIILFYELFHFVLSSILPLVEISLSGNSCFSLVDSTNCTEWIMQVAIEIISNSMSDFMCHNKDDIFLSKSLQIVYLIQPVKMFVSVETFRTWHTYFWVYIIRRIICWMCDENLVPPGNCVFRLTCHLQLTSPLDSNPIGLAQLSDRL